MSVFRIRFQVSDNYCSNFYLLCYLINDLVDMDSQQGMVVQVWNWAGTNNPSP